MVSSVVISGISTVVKTSDVWTRLSEVVVSGCFGEIVVFVCVDSCIFIVVVLTGKVFGVWLDVARSLCDVVSGNTVVVVCLVTIIVSGNCVLIVVFTSSVVV